MASPLTATVSGSQDYIGTLLPPASPHPTDPPMAAGYVQDVAVSGIHVPASYADSTAGMLPSSGYPMYSFSAPAPIATPMHALAGPPLQHHPAYRAGHWDMAPTYVQSPTSASADHVVYKLDPNQQGGHFSLAQTSSSA